MKTVMDIRGGLRAVLSRRDMTIKAFAQLVGVHDKNVHFTLRRNNLRFDTLIRWADALGLKPSELVREAELAGAKKQVADGQVAVHNAATNPTQPE